MTTTAVTVPLLVAGCGRLAGRLAAWAGWLDTYFHHCLVSVCFDEWLLLYYFLPVHSDELLYHHFLVHVHSDELLFPLLSGAC